ncbi:MAG: ATP-binding cassette domain-containing protein [Desulfovibrionaceae bacterium]|nr:ATP-binding cassette domain-containing protein [Desulfovibrionaceae bacterium]
MPQSLITLEHISVRLPLQDAAQPALHDISFSLYEGRHLALRGSNGAGKSTLLRLLRGDIWATQGCITWYSAAGAEHSPLVGKALCALVAPAQQEGYLRQGWNITGQELLLTGFDDSPLLYEARGEAAQREHTARLEAVAAMALRLDLEALLAMPIQHYSQGQLRLMLLARALVRRPRVLLLDECAEGLDEARRTHFFDILHEEAACCTLVMTTHRGATLPELFRHSITLDKGRLCTMPQQSPAKAAETSPAQACSTTAPMPIAAKAAPTAAPCTGHEDTAKAKSTAHAACPTYVHTAKATPCPDLAHATAPIHAASASATRCPAAPSAVHATNAPLICVSHADVYMEQGGFDSTTQILEHSGMTTAPAAAGEDSHINALGHKPVLRDICWSLHTGEHWFISGSNGAGKSTFLRLLAGEAYPAAGGSIVRTLPRHGGQTSVLEEIQQGIRLVSDLGQAVYSYDLNGFELLCSGFDNTIGLYREFSTAEQEQVHTLLQAWGLAHLAQRNIRTLSSGQLRLFFLARAMMGQPEVLLLDEPCSGLDSAARTACLARLQAIAEQGDTALVLVSHHTSDRIPALNRFAELNQGRLSLG